MGMFQTREPRKYRRSHMYTDERKEKLEKLVRDVKREMGELPPDDIEPDHFKGKFSQFPRAQRASEREHKLTWPLALIIIMVLLLVWRYILMGRL